MKDTAEKQRMDESGSRDTDGQIRSQEIVFGWKGEMGVWYLYAAGWKHRLMMDRSIKGPILYPLLNIFILNASGAALHN